MFSFTRPGIAQTGLYQPYHPTFSQARSQRGQPLPGPDQDVVRELYEQHHQPLRSQPSLADHCQPQPTLAALQRGFNARSPVIMLHDRQLLPFDARGEEACLLIPTRVVLCRRAHHILGEWTAKRDGLGDDRHLAPWAGGWLPLGDPTNQCADPAGRLERASDLLPSGAQPGDDWLTPPATVQANLDPSTFGLSGLILPFQSEHALRLGERVLENGQALGGAARHHRFPDRFLVLGRLHPHHLAPPLRAAAAHRAACRACCVPTGRQRREIHVQDELVCGPVVTTGLTVGATHLGERRLPSDDIGWGGAIYRGRTHRLIGTARPANGCPERGIPPTVVLVCETTLAGAKSATKTFSSFWTGRYFSGFWLICPWVSSGAQKPVRRK